MFSQNANSLTTHGIIGGAVGISTSGYLTYVVVITEQPVKRGGSSIVFTKYKKPPKIVSIAVFCYGKIFTDSVIVYDDVKVTADNVKVVEGEDGEIYIEVVGVEVLDW